MSDVDWSGIEGGDDPSNPTNLEKLSEEEAQSAPAGSNWQAPEPAPEETPDIPLAPEIDSSPDAGF